MKKSNLAIIGLAVIVISIVVISSPKDTKLDPDSEYVYHVNLSELKYGENETYKELFEPMQGEARPFYGEVRDESLTPITSEYLLKDRDKMDDAFREIIGHLNSLRTDRIGKAGVNVISAMEPADAQKYIDERLDTLGDINKYVVDMMEDLELEEAELLNSY